MQGSTKVERLLKLTGTVQLTPLLLVDKHHTLAGFLLERLQHIPSPGESVFWKGHQFEVLAMDGPRIERVEISRRLAESSSEEDL